MSRRILIRCCFGPSAALAFFLLVPLVFPRAADAGGLFPGYPDAVRTQAERVVALAGPGKETALAKGVWLVKEDLLPLSLPELTQDLNGLSGSLERFAPALIGYSAWLISFFSAAGCWFVVWGSISLFLRERPSLG